MNKKERLELEIYHDGLVMALIRRELSNDEARREISNEQLVDMLSGRLKEIKTLWQNRKSGK